MKCKNCFKESLDVSEDEPLCELCKVQRKDDLMCFMPEI